MPRILITGGCGFIGSSLAFDFVRRGYDVTVLDNLRRRGSELILPRLLAQGIVFHHGDIRHPEDFKMLKDGVVCLIVCAGEPSVLSGVSGDEAQYSLGVNLNGTLNSFEWARQQRVPVIFLSSSRIYPYDRLNACRYRETETRFEFIDGCEGVSPGGVRKEMPLDGVRSLYGAGKLSAELILREYAAQYNLPAIINRCGVVAGPWQMARPDQGIFTFWMARHYFKMPLQYIGFGGNGFQVRDLLHIQDLVDLVFKQIVFLTERPADFRGSVFNVGGSVFSSLSLRETTEICHRITGNRVAVTANFDNRPSDLIWYVTDNGDTESVFGWKPQRLPADILHDIFLWIRDNETALKGIFT
ncbi:MAG: NAD-dependent epimerase/dehydratase family protein [Candidatus Omnitrophota bacterium]